MEIVASQRYEIDGDIYTVEDIRITNITSDNEYKVAILFNPIRTDKLAFQAPVEQVLNDSSYKLLTY